MTKPYSKISTRVTPQSEPIPGSTQVKNNAGGFVWALDDWKRLDRFLVLGSEGGTYYVSDQSLTKDNADVVMRCIKADGLRTVRQIVEISIAGRAPKNDPALFALAMCAGLGNPETRKYALQSLPQIARIGTHLFHFLQYAEQFRGWGRGMRSAVAEWYNTQDPKDLAYQVIKYQQRDGWSNRDALRLSHAKSPVNNNIYKWVVDGWESVGPDAPTDDDALALIWAFETAKVSKDKRQIVRLITDYRLPREAIPTEFLNEPVVWEALLASKMPVTAMLRNLGKMTEVGVLKTMSVNSKMVIDVLTNMEILKKGRVHPLSILVAMRVYQQGHGDKGTLIWLPVTQVVDALDKAFYLSFGAVVPTGKAINLALDISGSMTGTIIAGMPIAPREASAAMALITANVENNYLISGFGDHYIDLTISPRQRLDDVIHYIGNLTFGSTDCSLPMMHALENGMNFDAFVVYTDNETWAGCIHPSQALEIYRQKTGINAKEIVVGMTSTGFSIADPNDPGQLDVVGFDTSVPNVMSDFIKG